MAVYREVKLHTRKIILTYVYLPLAHNVADSTGKILMLVQIRSHDNCLHCKETDYVNQ